MQYHCLVDFDPNEVFSDSPEANAVLAAIGPHEAELRANGHLVMSQPLNMPHEAITVRVRNSKTSTTDGPYIETKDILGGMVLIEARDQNEAVRIAAGMPHALLGAIEVWPAIDFSKPRPKL
jgi:hypothetical protein